MKKIEEIDIGDLRQAIKALNDSGLHPEGKMKAIGVKQNLIEEFTKRFDDIPDEVEMPKLAVEFYEDIYADELEDEEEEVETDETDETADETDGAEVESLSGEVEDETDVDMVDQEGETDELETTAIDDEDNPEEDELLIETKDEPETGHYDKKTILQVIKHLQPAVDQHVLFTPEDIVAYNGEICMKYPYFTDMNCAINQVDLYKTLSKFPADTFQMSFDKVKNEMQITAPGVRAGYISSPQINLIDSLEEVIDDTDKINWEKLPADFLHGVALVHFAASKSTLFGTSTCIYVNGDEIVATDRTRISHYKMSGNMGEFFVRAEHIKHLEKLEPTGFGLTNNWAHFQNDQFVTVSFRLMQGEFPEYADLIDYNLSDSIKLTKAFENMIKVAQTMSKRDSRHKVCLSVGDGKITCKAVNDRGWITTDTDVDYKGDAFTFIIDPTFLLEAMKSGVTGMGLVSENALAFEAENFKHIIALLAEKSS